MKTIRRCEIVSNLTNGDEILFDLENMRKVLEERTCIADYSYIIHDKDVYTSQEEEQNPEHKAGTLKTEHIHLLLRFEDNQPQKLECVAKWFGIQENFINKIKGRWEDACLYQTHKNAQDKYQYSVDEVTCNFDYESLLMNEANKTNLEIIIQRILNGEIREYNKTLEISNMLLVMQARVINEAFKVRSEHLQATVKDRNMECIYITGTSGSGKTTLAKMIAEAKGLDYYISSGSNDILDGYSQEPCVIIDDARPSIMSLSDFLKMLDNNTHSTVKSRYKNKFLQCDLLILTSILDIDTFYKNVFSEHEEPIMQIKRRCKTYIRMDKESIYISLWDDKLMKYTSPNAYKNNVLEKYIPAEPKTKEDVSNHVAKWIPFLEPEKEKIIKCGNFQLQKMEHIPEVISEENFKELFEK